MRLLKYAITGLFVSLAITAHAATSWDVANEPQFFLDSTITSSQTTGIRLSAPFLNGEEVNLITTTGGVLRFRQGVKREDVYYSSASVNSSTKVVTLSGVIRDLCRGVTRAIQGCGQGQQFNKGAIVELSVDARLLNLKGNLDRSNVWTASGALGTQLNGSGVLILPLYTDSATRLLQVGSNPRNGLVACDISAGTCSYRLGGQWISFGSGAQVNASITISGKAQASTATALRNLTDTGSTGALNFLTPSLSVKNGSGSTSAGKLVQTNSNGVVAVSLGGTGLRTILTGALIIGQGAGNVAVLPPGAANTVIVSDGTRWAAGSVPQDVDVLTGSIATSNTLTNPQSSVRFTQTGSLSSTAINTKGKMFEVFAAGDSGWGAGTMQVALYLGDQQVGFCTFTPTASGQAWAISFRGVTRTAGASGVMQVNSLGSMGTGTNQKACSQSTNTTSFDTTVNKVVNIGIQFGASNGSNNASMHQFVIDSRTP